jgi:hypothetical protein
MRNVASRRATNKIVKYNNILADFTNRPMYTGSLLVKDDLIVYGKTYLGELDVNGNLRVRSNIACDINIAAQGTIRASSFVAGQVANITMKNASEIGQASTITVLHGVTSQVFSFSYTPKIANSYLIIEYQCNYKVDGGAADGVTAFLNVGDTSGYNRLTANIQYWNNTQGGGTRSGTMLPITGRYTNTDTTAKNITVDVSNGTDVDNMYLYSNDCCWLKITEIGR